MFRTILFPLILGLGGIAVLLSLAYWQLDRLAWKEGILDGIDARLAAPAVPVPAAPDAGTDAYLAVAVTGTPSREELHVLTSGTAAGTGYRVISALETLDGRRILLDQGLLALDAKDQPPRTEEATFTGNLIWPDDVNSSTPEPDLERNIWFGRDVAAMAEMLDTEPVMVVARDTPDPRLAPLPLDSARIKNDHLEYAITWFALAAVWAVMSVALIARNLRRSA